ncbi:MAG: hypothetical protein DSY66_03010 [Persephonella sp.]|nr:MAG: hypothetical protein DSY53_02590 [Persephonella sp.]RUM61047.1 MAG: hypothetical protein DSY66_03010 [Persephonella sp.]
MRIPDNIRIKRYKPKKLPIIVEIVFFSSAILFLIYIIFFGKDTLEFLKRKKLEMDLKNLQSVLINYRKKYNFFAGDDPKAEERCPDGIYILNGNGSNYIGDYRDEEEQAIRHLRCLKFLDGDFDEKYISYPKNPYGGIYKYSFVKINGKKYNVIKITNLDKKRMLEIDKDLDDGNLKTGKVRYLEEKRFNKKDNLLILIIR